VEQLVSQLIAVMAQVPPPLVYVIVALWVGAESAGIGVPIELMLLFVGSLGAQGRTILPLAVVCAAVGCLVFATLAYMIGRRVGTRSITRIGRFIGLNQTRADHIELWMRHRGAAGVLIARETPIVRTYGSYIMGAADIPIVTFVLGTFIGSLVYCALWIIVGAALGENYRAPLHYLDQVGAPGIAIAVGVVAVVVLLHHFAGRLGLHRIALHFRRHQQARVAAVQANAQ
jgi:membrane protein DedA with SNARE-associated domain